MLHQKFFVVALLSVFAIYTGCHKKPFVPLTLSDIEHYEAKLVGTWAKGFTLEVSSLTIAQSGEKYSVHFQTAGCVGEDDKTLSASFANSVLHLDAPIREYSSEAYDTIYVLRVDNETLLVPSIYLDEFMANLNKNHGHYDGGMRPYTRSRY